MEKNISQKNDVLKIIAVITMLIDHVGYTIILSEPFHSLLRIIGRIAFPIFAYQLAIGYLHTSNVKRYISRMFIFGVISQIPYMYAFSINVENYRLNIFFTLLCALLLIDALHKKRVYLIPLYIIASFYIPFDFGWYGVLMPLLFYIFLNTSKQLTFKQKGLAFLSHFALLIGYFAFQSWGIQLFAIFGVLICLYLPTKHFKLTINKHFFYWFYPAHLCVLYGVVWFLKITT